MAKPVKQPININFAKGLDLKTDPYQVPVGSFLSLVNSVFDKVGRLTKRNGFPYLTPVPNTTTSYLTTFNGDLQAIGDNILALSSSQSSWLPKGSTYPVKLSTMPLIRNSINQSQTDTAIAPNDLVCTVYTEVDPSGVIYKYAVADSITGQNILAPAILTGANTTYGTPRVYVVGNYFVILFTKGTSTRTLNYLAVSYQNTNLTPIAAQVAGAYDAATTVAFDAVLLNNSLFIAYNGPAGVGIEMVSLNSTLVLSSTVLVDDAHTGTIFSIAADVANQFIWVTYFAGSTAYTTVVTTNLITQLIPTLVIPSGTILNITSTVVNDVMTFFYEVSNNYSYDSGIPTHFIKTNTLTLPGTLGTSKVSIRAVGLASKAFLVDEVSYYLAVYQSPYQPTYFLVNGTVSTEASPVVTARLAYQNGGGYLVHGLPNVAIRDNSASIAYLYKDLIQSVNKNTNVPSGSQVDGIYSQTGINQANFTFTTDGIASAEIGQNLNLTGGFLWMYDGYLPVEQNFLVYPDSIEVASDATSGSMSAQQYFYQVTYEWTDNQGNAFRSAPSIPVTVTLTSDTSVAIDVPTLRLTYKVANPVKIVIYRWSQAQQSYYQVTSIASPTLNDTTTDSIAFIDTLADSAILGNNLLYTTGGTVEDTAAPASNILALFDDRLWLVDAEDPNLLWFSKQVIEGTPVEMSDLFTLYVAPTTGSQGSTGDITAIFPMDDKLIIFKSNAMYYINGTGPDNTGANNSYSQPIFIAATVGCTNTRSIVLTPRGLMFQSDKGIWLLDRNLGTSYIGAEVEDFNGIQVTSAVAIPKTNQVRFGLATTTVNDTDYLLYDYYVGQWGEFKGIESVSSTLYQKLHTIVNQYGQVSQEKPNTYLDGTRPVLMSFTTSWLQLAGLRGYMRAFWMFLLGTYLSPHKLNVSVGYDYEFSHVQSDLVIPGNFSGNYGTEPYYGGTGANIYGSKSLEQARIFFRQQRCKAFQLTIQEVFDPTLGPVAGPGLTLSGLNCTVGLKNTWAPIPQSQQYG